MAPSFMAAPAPFVMAGPAPFVMAAPAPFVMAGPAPFVMAGLDPAISHPNQIANDAIPVSNHPMTMTGSSPAMTTFDRCVRYVNSKGARY